MTLPMNSEQPQRTLRRPRIAPGVHVRRAPARKRQKINAEQAMLAMDRRTQTLDTMLEVVQSTTGLTVSTNHPDHEGAYELVIDIPFGGPRSGKFSLALSRGLTRQVATAMAEMPDYEGRPLNALEAARELSCAVAHKLLVSFYGAEATSQLGVPEVCPSRPLNDVDVVTIGVSDGILAVRFFLDTSTL
jgi:hypothetical protein